jgi:hypothetical protein
MSRWLSKIMKKRPYTTTSERELQIAMTNAGRPTSLVTLTRWRREGLLPAFASHGLGRGKGTSYYWRESEIGAHALYLYDLLDAYERRDVVLLILWLSGFEVSLVQVRRAWLQYSKHKMRWKVRRTEISDKKFTKGRRVKWPKDRLSFGENQTPLHVLLSIALIGSEALELDQPASVTATLRELSDQVFAKMGWTKRSSSKTAKMLLEQSFAILAMISSALENSNFLSVANDKEMLDARRYSCLAGQFIRLCVSNGDEHQNVGPNAPFWTPLLAEHLAAPLFLFALALLRVGYDKTLGLTATEVDRLCERWEMRSTLKKLSRAADASQIARFNSRCAAIWNAKLQLSL